MSIFQLAEPAAPSFEAEVSAIALQRLADQQSMIAEAEALLGKLADATWHVVEAEERDPGPAVIEPAPKPRRGRKRLTNDQVAQIAAIDCRGGLNAVGKPYSPQYDPKYRMKYRTPKPAIKAGSSTAAHIRDLDGMRAHIAQHWSA